MRKEVKQVSAVEVVGSEMSGVLEQGNLENLDDFNDVIKSDMTEFAKLEAIREGMRCNLWGTEALDALSASVKTPHFQIVGNTFIVELVQGIHREPLSEFDDDMVIIVKVTALRDRHFEVKQMLHLLNDEKSADCVRFKRALERVVRNGSHYARLIIDSAWEIKVKDFNNNLIPFVGEVTLLNTTQSLTTGLSERYGRRVRDFVLCNRDRITRKDANDYTPDEHIGIYVKPSKWGGGNVAIRSDILFGDIFEGYIDGATQNSIKKRLIAEGILIDRCSVGYTNKFTFAKCNYVINYVLYIEELGDKNV